MIRLPHSIRKWCHRSVKSMSSMTSMVGTARARERTRSVLCLLVSSRISLLHVQGLGLQHLVPGILHGLLDLGHPHLLRVVTHGESR